MVRCTLEECVDGKMYINTDTAYSRDGLAKAHKHVSHN